MSCHSALRLQERTDTEPTASRAILQRKCDCDLHAFDSGKCTDLHSQGQSFNLASIGAFAASRFGSDFSRVRLHSNEALPSRRTQLMVQRFPKNEGDASAATEQAAETPPTPTSTVEPIVEAPIPEETHALGLIVEDSTTDMAPGQMRKSEFLAQLRTEVCRTAEAAMAGTDRTTADCPYLDYWFGYYIRKDSAHIERAIHRYTPETANVTTARGYIPIIAGRVRRAVDTWVRTGEVTGVPEGVPTTVPAETPAESDEAATTVASSVMFKAREGGARAADGPQAIQAELGDGQPLNSGVRSRMESAFGMDFAHVRTHTDTTASGLSNRLNARAFTVGEHIAFGANEYKPGTLIGDAIIAHEMAHVVQQRGASASTSPMKTGNTGYNMLENDADKSAMGVLTSLWGGVKDKLLDTAQNAMTRLRSGLYISRCERRSSRPCPRHNTITKKIDVFELAGCSVNPKAEVAAASKIWKREAGISLNPTYKPRFNEQETRKLIGIESSESSKPVEKLVLDYTTIPTGTREMNNLRSKRRGNLTVFFIPRLGYIAPAAIDPVLRNEITYIGGQKCSTGFTLAHELGHLFLGPGHSNWDSQLMRPARCNPSLTELECRMARGDNYAWREFFQQGGKL